MVMPDGPMLRAGQLLQFRSYGTLKARLDRSLVPRWRALEC
jgi:hypothetical protein